MLHEFVLGRASVMVMDYVNSASRAIKDAANEVAYGTQVSRGVVLALETMELRDEPTATFYGQTSDQLEQALQELHNAYVKNGSFEAVCVHHYGSWKLFNSGFSHAVFGPARDLYVWDNGVVLDSQKRAVFFADLAKMSGKIRRVYLESHTLVNSQKLWANLTDFAKQLYSKQVRLELMSGDSVWAKPEKHAIAVTFVNSSIQYLKSEWNIISAGSHMSHSIWMTFFQLLLLLSLIISIQ